MKPGYQQQRLPPGLSTDADGVIVNVWAGGLEAAFERIRDLVRTHRHVAMDTEFPGFVATPLTDAHTAHSTEFYYQAIRCNVNNLKMIQFGLTLSNEDGEQPLPHRTWQFNFKYDLTAETLFARESVDMLRANGIDFKRCASDGIDIDEFAEHLLTSGLIFGGESQVTWLSFHAGYDFGYLIRALSKSQLPEREEDFIGLMETYFPGVYDVKYLLKQAHALRQQPMDVSRVGLAKLADELGVSRVGQRHQAGSDSLLTCDSFFKLRSDFFSSGSLLEHKGVLYGLGTDSATAAVHTLPAAPSPHEPPSETQWVAEPEHADVIGRAALTPVAMPFSSYHPVHIWDPR
eukprot:TRINITY_DN43131_c0_g1_i1.p2 TRINITY_DN43131_c0_g1~~TRINITY_DN43131_c0_g1_i1.p2  ORF type:complete len:346 (+),score=141.34 TRINITY_DN43131_c0_g1_i1:64-1101(+)